jgi:hypothetical protein
MDSRRMCDHLEWTPPLKPAGEFQGARRRATGLVSCVKPTGFPGASPISVILVEKLPSDRLMAWT